MSLEKLETRALHSTTQQNFQKLIVIHLSPKLPKPAPVSLPFPLPLSLSLSALTHSPTSQLLLVSSSSQIIPPSLIFFYLKEVDLLKIPFLSYSAPSPSQRKAQKTHNHLSFKASLVRSREETKEQGIRDKEERKAGKNCK